MSIGEQIRKIRTQQKLTVKKLSEMCSVPEKTIYRIETGEVQDPKISSIEPIIKALNCSADEILFSHDDYYKFGELRQVFTNITQMHEDDREMLIRMIRMVCLASSFEQQISDNAKNLTKVN
jgi:transcriptional regulator with XRE-family HTH domain